MGLFGRRWPDPGHDVREVLVPAVGEEGGEDEAVAHIQLGLPPIATPSDERHDQGQHDTTFCGRSAAFLSAMHIVYNCD